MSAVQTGTLRRVASSQMPTKWGMFDAVASERDVSKGTRGVETALALVMRDLTDAVPLLRIHSQCFTGEVLGSLRCDCHDQLEMAMQAIAKEGRGLVIYEYQDGIEVVPQLACEVAPNPHSFANLRAKKEKMGHALNSWQCEGTHQTKHSPTRRSRQPKPHRPRATSAAHTVAITTEPSTSHSERAALRPALS
jgi:GTP cyclohydrolase II